MELFLRRFQNSSIKKAGSPHNQTRGNSALLTEQLNLETFSFSNLGPLKVETGQNPAILAALQKRSGRAVVGRLFVPGALAAVALKHADGFFSLRVVDRSDQSQLVIARTALSEWVAVVLEISKLLC